MTERKRPRRNSTKTTRNSRKFPKPKQSGPTLETLPNEVLTHILSLPNLDPLDIISTRKVRFFQLVKSQPKVRKC